MKVEYWADGYMKFNKEFHPNHCKPWKTEDIKYIVDRYGKDNISDISLALGRTAKTIGTRIYLLKKNGIIN